MAAVRQRGTNKEMVTSIETMPLRQARHAPTHTQMRKGLFLLRYAGILPSQQQAVQSNLNKILAKVLRGMVFLLIDVVTSTTQTNHKPNLSCMLT